ncbi:unnamed protein product [Camellia sinensis]
MEILMEKHEVNSSPIDEKEVLALELDLHPPNNTKDDDDDGDTANRLLIPNNTTDQGIDVSKAALLIGFFTLISGSTISALCNLKDSGKTETKVLNIGRYVLYRPVRTEICHHRVGYSPVYR